VVSVDEPPGVFDDLQDAVDAADDGATITVAGTCRGRVRITGREDLTIEGTPPVPAGCPPGGLGPADLTATVAGGSDEVIKVRRSEGIAVRFLNITEGRSAGIEFKTSEDGVLECSCVARNGDEGVELDGGEDHQVVRNLVTENRRDGIRLKESEDNTVGDNVVADNGSDGIEIEQESDGNTVIDNLIFGNGADGIDLDDSDGNRVVDNVVVENGTDEDRDSGVELRNSDRNVVDGNEIRGNADGLVGEIRCQRGSRKNTGSNVTERCE
jgi:parallel beta-helix repeat protein